MNYGTQVAEISSYLAIFSNSLIENKLPYLRWGFLIESFRESQ